MSDPQIDPLLERRAKRMPAVDPAALERIAHRVRANLTAVRPWLPPWLLASTLAVGCALVAIAGAALAGFEGVVALGPWRSFIVLATLASLTGIMARECVARFIPGHRLRSSAGGALAACSVSLVLLFTLLFGDYHASHFIAAGVACLEQGVLHGVPSGILCAVLLRRGFATRPVLAALTAGALAGLTGVLFLEMHCTNLEAPHLIVWHTAVVPVSAGLTALGVFCAHQLRSSISRKMPASS